MFSAGQSSVRLWGRCLLFSEGHISNQVDRLWWANCVALLDTGSNSEEFFHVVTLDATQRTQNTDHARTVEDFVARPWP